MDWHELAREDAEAEQKQKNELVHILVIVNVELDVGRHCRCDRHEEGWPKVEVTLDEQ